MHAAGASVAIDFADPAVRADPYPVYRRLRDEAPVVWNEVTRSWLVSRYDDVMALFTDARLSSARAEALFATLPPEAREEFAPLRHILGSRMLLTDPPEHTRLKNLVMQAFAARASEGRREQARAFCDRFLGQVVASGACDVMRDLAGPLPSWVIADLLGVPRDDQPLFTAWAADQVRVYDRPGTAHDRLSALRRGQTSMLAMRAYLEDVIAARRAAPRDDLISELILAEEQGDRLSTDELIIMVVALLVGGNNSTAHLIGNAVLTHLRHPAAAAALRDDPALARSAIEETLRYESPVQATSRVVRAPVEIGAHVMRPGDSVHLLIGSANRDERQFPDPERFDLARGAIRHLTFAHGPHFCLGSSVARVTAQEALLAVARRCPDARLLDDTPAWSEGFSFRHLRALPIAFTPR